MPVGEVVIGEFLRDEGFDTPVAAGRARRVLEQSAVTRPGKHAFVETKLESARSALAVTLIRVCGEACLAVDRSGPSSAREPVVVTQPSCEVCGGSNNRRAAIEARRALARKGIRRIVVVGGSPGTREQLNRVFEGAEVEMKLIDGTSKSLTAKEAIAHEQWAQLVIIWGSTELRHAVSALYTKEPPPHLRLITVGRRSVEALCAEITRSYT
jgi:hypothetical protein